MKKYIYALFTTAILFALCGCKPASQSAQDPEFKTTYTVKVSQDFLDVADIFVSYTTNDKTTVETKMDSTVFSYEYKGTKGNNAGFSARYEKKDLSEYTKAKYQISCYCEIYASYGNTTNKDSDNQSYSTNKADMTDFLENFKGFFPQKFYASLDNNGDITITKSIGE